MYIYKQTTTW